MTARGQLVRWGPSWGPRARGSGAGKGRRPCAGRVPAAGAAGSRAGLRRARGRATELRHGGRRAERSWQLPCPRLPSCSHVCRAPRVRGDARSRRSHGDAGRPTCPPSAAPAPLGLLCDITKGLAGCGRCRAPPAGVPGAGGVRVARTACPAHCHTGPPPARPTAPALGCCTADSPSSAGLPKSQVWGV